MDTNLIQIRYEWHHENCRWNYSIVDSINTAITTADARNYWKVLKNRLKKRDNSIVGCCNQLKMRSRDGKMYNTDTADAHTILQIIRIAAGTPLPHIETWIQIIESKTPEQKPTQIFHIRSSFPQVRKLDKKALAKYEFHNRFKSFFRVK